MRDPTYPLFSVFAFVGFVITLIPLPWHFQAWNAGTCAYMIWVSLACLVEFVNSVIWSGNVNNVAPIWCDISAKFLLGAGIGIPAASLCISRRLYKIAAVQAASVSREDKRRAVITDICITAGIPVIVMALHYVVQGHRFDILEDIGCYPVIYNTLPAYFLVFMWPVLLGCVSFVYSSLTLRSFLIRRMQLNEFMSSNHSMNASRYLRLMILAIMDMMCTVPISIYSVYLGNLGVGLAPWISWSDVHFNFSQVNLVPTLIWRSDPAFQTSVELTRWLYPAAAFLFFALFGFASEAQKNYRAVCCWIGRCFGFNPTSTKGANGLSSGLPSWVKPLKTNPTSSIGTLPVYTLSKSGGRKARSDSFASSLTGTSIGIDIEKSIGPSSTLVPSPTSTASPSSPQRGYHNKDDVSENHDCDSFRRISISDAYSSQPPSPSFTVSHDLVMGHPPDASFSAHRRPLNPPNARSHANPAPAGGKILVTVHRLAHRDV